MKRIQILSLFVIATSMFLCTSCKPDGKPPKGDIDISVIEKKLISTDSAKAWARRYTDTRYKILTENLGFQDNRTSWYSVEELETYIAYAKREAKKKGFKINGFRLRLAVNPESYYREEGPLTTIYISPTRPYSQQGSFFAFQPGPGGDDDTGIHALEHGGVGNPPNAQ